MVTLMLRLMVMVAVMVMEKVRVGECVCGGDKGMVKARVVGRMEVGARLRMRMTASIRVSVDTSVSTSMDVVCQSVE